MHLEVILEEPSAREALEFLLPRIAPGCTHKFHIHRGKEDLLRKLPGRMKGYAAWLPEGYRVLVLTDRDDDDCIELKTKLEAAAHDAGLPTQANAGEVMQAKVMNRIAVEELEAWFLGDVQAICTAYPRVPSSLAAQRPFRDPDAIRGGTAEALERELQKTGDHPGGLEKVRAAREIARHMDPDRNTSHSFQVFRDGLRNLVKTAE